MLISLRRSCGEFFLTHTSTWVVFVAFTNSNCHGKFVTCSTHCAGYLIFWGSMFTILLQIVHPLLQKCGVHSFPSSSWDNMIWYNWCNAGMNMSSKHKFLLYLCWWHLLLGSASFPVPAPGPAAADLPSNTCLSKLLPPHHSPGPPFGFSKLWEKKKQ